MPFRHDAGVFRPNEVSRRNFDGLKTPNPSSFGHRVCLGKKVEAKNPNGVSAKCAIVILLRVLYVVAGTLTYGRLAYEWGGVGRQSSVVARVSFIVFNSCAAELSMVRNSFISLTAQRYFHSLRPEEEGEFEPATGEPLSPSGLQTPDWRDWSCWSKGGGTYRLPAFAVMWFNIGVWSFSPDPRFWSFIGTNS
jgi:hypothetical protein